MVSEICVHDLCSFLELWKAMERCAWFGLYAIA